MIRGIRGAVTVNKNTSTEIVKATARLLKEMTVLNRVKLEDIAAVIFSVTCDLNAEFPAEAARRLGWRETPLFCTCEINVPGSLKKCIRVLMLVNSKRPQTAMQPVYLGKGKKLRPDL